jgi:hypothetical protein
MKDSTSEHSRKKAKAWGMRPKGERGYSPELLAFVLLMSGAK